LTTADSEHTKPERAVAPRHVVPFLTWMVLMVALGDPAAWKYAARTVAVGALLLWARPWECYGWMRPRNLPLAVVTGIAVLGVWVLPEHAWTDGWTAFRDIYLRYAVLPLGDLPELTQRSPYAPQTCGPALTAVRWFGSAVVIALVEEFFWRGFLYRWLIQSEFTEVSVKERDWRAFLIMVALFGVEHNRWFVGMLAGAAYGGLLLRTGDIWAVVVAHGVTNGLLGLYVLRSGHYAFW